jgi:hypothetical protein
MFSGMERAVQPSGGDYAMTESLTEALFRMLP